MRSPTAPRTPWTSPGPSSSDRFGILYDLYHSIVQGEDPATELANAAGFVKYVQLADAPGRHEPGSGDVDWPAQLAVRPRVRLRRPDRPGVLPGGRVGGVDRVHPVGRRGRVTEPAGKIDVLLATGRVTVEHDNEFRSFRHHTSMLTALLESTGRFRVRVLEEFRGIGDELLDRFDVVLVMYEGRDDYHSVAEGFGTTTEQALLRFVRDEGPGHRLVPRLVGAGAGLGLARGVRPDARRDAQPGDGTAAPAAGRGRGADGGPAPPDHRRASTRSGRSSTTTS